MADEALHSEEPSVEEVTYPRDAGKQAIALTRTKSFRAWSGGPDELKRLARTVETALEREFVILRNRNNESQETSGQDANRELARNMKLRVDLYAAGGIERRAGDLEAILAEVDPRDIDGIRLGNYQALGRAQAGFPLIDLRLGALPGTDARGQRVLNPTGPYLRVSGGSRNWVSGTLSEVSAILAKRVPPWSVALTTWAAWLFALTVVGGVSAILYAVFRPSAETVASLLTLVLFGLMMVLLGTVALAPKLFPRFEVVPAGQTDAGRRVMALVFGLVMFFLAVAGVLLPFLL